MTRRVTASASCLRSSRPPRRPVTGPARVDPGQLPDPRFLAADRDTEGVCRRPRRCRWPRPTTTTWKAAPSNGPLTVEYTVYAWDLSVRGAHLDETHAFFNGTSVFLCVEGQAHLPCLVELQPPPGIDGWKVYYQPAGSARRAGRRPAPRLWPVPGARLRRADRSSGGDGHAAGRPFYRPWRRARTGVHGHRPALDLPRIARDVQRICETQIAFFEPQSRRAPFLDSSDRYVVHDHGHRRRLRRPGASRLHRADGRAQGPARQGPGRPRRRLSDLPGPGQP